jgi:general secretion pathway protein E
VATKNSSDVSLAPTTTIGQALIAVGLIEASDMAQAERLAATSGMGLVKILPQLGLASEQQLADSIGAICGLPVLSSADFPSEYPAIEGLNLHWLAHAIMIPLSVTGKELRVATADPWHEENLKHLAFASGFEIDVCIAKPSDIEEKLRRSHYSDAAKSPVDGLSGSLANSDEMMAQILEGVSEAPAIRHVQSIISSAIRIGASDIHIEPMAKNLSVRYRIDGRLKEVDSHAIDQAKSIASRIKILSGLDIAETRLPQDGRMQFNYQGQDIDIRVSTSPIAYGESVVLRLLGRNQTPLDIRQIGLPDSMLADFIKLLERPNGMILLTGPTGSGKTTTLYSALNHLRRPEVKILTVEDPVEILLDGVNQVQVRPEIGLDYANSLRAFLRQDPDIIMVGEIRDRDTADIALRASLTGHLVLSSLHTNSAIGAFERLTDIGIEPFLTASTVIASVAQRLIRTICSKCATTRDLSAMEQDIFARWDVAAPAQLHEPVGCSACENNGYRGRIPVLELITMTDELRALVQSGQSASYRLPPEKQLPGHALNLVAAGKTSLAEAIRVTGVS